MNSVNKAHAASLAKRFVSAKPYERVVRPSPGYCEFWLTLTDKEGKERLAELPFVTREDAQAFCDEFATIVKETV